MRQELKIVKMWIYGSDRYKNGGGDYGGIIAEIVVRPTELKMVLEQGRRNLIEIG